MSGIYIPGMEMPTSCSDCPMLDWDLDYIKCKVTGRHFKVKEEPFGARRVDDCPLVPVPEHGRLIDADALIDDMANMIPWVIESPEEIAMMDGLSAGYEAVGAAPTIIPADPADKEAQDG